MKFYISNPVLDNQIEELLCKIRLSMNGLVSEQMTQRNIIYKQNYGVVIPRIREIAKQYPKNHDLAQRLWMLKIRETMILATLLEPEEKFTIENAFKWLADCEQIELVEQLCMNLFCRLTCSNELCVRLIKSDELWKQITGFMLVARIFQHINEEETKWIVLEAVKKSETVFFHLYKVIALSLSRLSRKNKEAAAFIAKAIEPFLQSDVIGQQYIFHEVKEEILFLNFL